MNEPKLHSNKRNKKSLHIPTKCTFIFNGSIIKRLNGLAILENFSHT